jgi:hypothetical protein
MTTAEVAVLGLALALVAAVTNAPVLSVRARCLLLTLALVAGILAALHRQGTL